MNIICDVNSLKKTLMLGKTEGRRRRGWQRMRWLDGIIDSMDLRFEQTLGDSEGQESLVCYSPWGCKELDRTEPLTCSLSTNKLPGAIHLFLLSLLSMFILVRLPYDPRIAPSSWRCPEWQQKGNISFLCLLLWSRNNDLEASLWSSPHMPMLEPACMIHVLKDRAAGGKESKIRVLSLWWLVSCVNLAKL